MKVILQIIGFALLLAGIVLMISPVPFSFTIAILGASLIIANNRTVAGWVRAWRMRWPAFDRAFSWVEHLLPRHWRVDEGSVFEEFSKSRKEPD